MTSANPKGLLAEQAGTLISKKVRRCLLALFFATSLIYLAILPPTISSIDEDSMLTVAESLLVRHNVTVPEGSLGIPGRDGKYYSSWYPLLSFASTPFVAAGLLLGKFTHLPRHYVIALFALAFSALVSAFAVLLVALIALRLGSTEAGAIRAALTYAFGTTALVYTRTFYAEPLLTVVSLAALYFAFNPKARSTSRCSVVCALAVLAKPPGILVGFLVSGYLAVRRKQWRTVPLPAAGSMIGLWIYGLYNWARFGHALQFGQPTAFALANFGEGFVGQLISPGRGLIWYSPTLLALVGLPRETWRRAEAQVIGALFLSYLVLYSIWGFWQGGVCWGPRFLLPGIAGLSVLTALLGRTWSRVLVFLACLGFLVNAPMLVSTFKRTYSEAMARGETMSQTLWSFRDSPLVNGWPAAGRQVQDAESIAPRKLVSAAGASGDTIDPVLAAKLGHRCNECFIVTQWWWMLPLAHVPRMIGASISAAMILFGLWMLRRRVWLRLMEPSS